MVLCFRMVVWFYGLTAVWLYGFMVLWFDGCIVLCVLLWLCGFMVSKNTNFISCFQEYIDPISKIFKTLLDGSSGLFGARVFQN